MKKKAPMKIGAWLAAGTFLTAVGSCGGDSEDRPLDGGMDASPARTAGDATIDAHSEDVALVDSSNNVDSSDGIVYSCPTGTYHGERAWILELEDYCSTGGCPGGSRENTEAAQCAKRYLFRVQRVVYEDCGLIGVYYRIGESTGEYIYERTSGELVGAVYQNDAPVPCKDSGTSHNIYTTVGGRIPESEGCPAIRRIDLCPDDDAGVADAN
jgi:hypothetical protein